MWEGRKLVLETGRMARQANGAVLVSYGETVVLCTAVGVAKASPDASFFPLSVHYQEKSYAVGKIPGGFLKRESKPSEKEVLTSRLIDRPLRPLFPDHFLNEVQVLCTVLSYDGENDPDMVAMIGASAALAISGMPFKGPIAGIRVGYRNGDFLMNPTPEEMAQSAMDLVVAGTKEGILMVESEIAELDDEIVLKGVEKGHKALQPVIKLIDQLVKKAGKPAWEVVSDAEHAKLEAAILKHCTTDIQDAFHKQDKASRNQALDAVLEKAASVCGDEVNPLALARAFKASKEVVLREGVLAGKRIDGRKLDTIRSIWCDTKVLPRTHGSALFTRGETQALVVATLGASDDAQLMDALEGAYKETFLLHYNFPPYSVGEAGRFGAPGRREIGHGKLAWRSIRPMLPAAENFPYTLRVVSEITESNGSSSMATVCGTSLALMDAGIALERPVAGIAMGLIKEGDNYAVLSDITGDEDSLGDMDFKVAGTKEGITALQMDIKITSITSAIMKKAIIQAKQGRLFILGEMAKALKEPRKALSPHAPRMEVVKIAKEKIKDVVGPGGKVIRELCEKTEAKIDIEDDGTVRVFAPTDAQLQVVLQEIADITYEPKVGEIVEGEVVNILDFGAFVDFKGATGLVHVSELAEERVKNVTDVLSLGQMVRVKVIGFDRGKIKLSLKQAAKK
ncbi:MAG: polyribonucleotide nucleotidyltransferase [Holosporaceae bacterium]